MVLSVGVLAEWARPVQVGRVVRSGAVLAEFGLSPVQVDRVFSVAVLAELVASPVQVGRVVKSVAVLAERMPVRVPVASVGSLLTASVGEVGQTVPDCGGVRVGVAGR